MTGSLRLNGCHPQVIHQGAHRYDGEESVEAKVRLVLEQGNEVCDNHDY